MWFVVSREGDINDETVVLYSSVNEDDCRQYSAGVYGPHIVVEAISEDFLFVSQPIEFSEIVSDPVTDNSGTISTLTVNNGDGYRD